MASCIWFALLFISLGCLERNAAVNGQLCGGISCQPYSTCQQSASGDYECVCNGACTTSFEPVCGSNNVTYTNLCDMMTASCHSKQLITVRHDGQCDPMQITCASILCGFHSTCQRKPDNSFGCVCSTMCPAVYRPVCGSDGLTYSNLCSLYATSCRRRVTIVSVYEGECNGTADPCQSNPCPYYGACQGYLNGTYNCHCVDEACPQALIYDPICGTNGVTYPGECEMKKASCRTKRMIMLAHRGVCGVINPCQSNPCDYYGMCVRHNNGSYDCRCSTNICPQTLVYDPICGSNGVTYPGECEMKKESCERRTRITVAHRGQCGSIDPCRSNPCKFNAVCESNSNGTYNCHCPSGGCPQTFRYDPICGSNGITYPGECEMEKASCRTKTVITMAHRGECGTINPCESNPCHYYGICRHYHNGTFNCHCSTEVCPLMFRYDPICGSDGVTYPGECEMKKMACASRTMITVAHHGQCGANNPCNNNPCQYYGICHSNQTGGYSCHCPMGTCTVTMDGSPVCGSDGVSYINQCEMKKTACRTQTMITIAYYGQCGASTPAPCGECKYYGQCRASANGLYRCSCDEGCTDEYDPVCGSNNVTYSNLCELKSESCRSSRMITVKHKGQCRVISPCAAIKCGYYSTCQRRADDTYGCVCNTMCTEEYNPVCGSNHVTYSNLCFLRSAACSQQMVISPLHRGECNANSTNPCALMLCPYGKICLTTIEGKGECICQNVCTREYLPVCGTDGVTYPNECEIKCSLAEGVGIAHHGPCEDHKPMVQGTVTLPAFHSPMLGDKSCLRVIVFDDRIADAPSVKVGESVYHINSQYNPEDPLAYNVALVSETGGTYFGVSAVLNINWCSHGQDKWVRPGDYLTTEAYHIGIDDTTPMHLKLEMYGSTGCSGDVPCSYGARCIEAKEGQASCVKCGAVCTDRFDPVCGSDGNTYPNACAATALNDCVYEQVHVDHGGECKDDDDQETIWIIIIVLAALCLISIGVIATVHFIRKKQVFVPKQVHFVKPSQAIREIEIVKDPGV